MEKIASRLYYAGIREEVPSQEISKLNRFDGDADAIVYTLRARYDDSVHCEVFEIPGVDLVRGHFLLRNGYNTVEKIAALSEHELKQMKYLDENSASKILDGARRLSPERLPNDAECQYVYLDSNISKDSFRSRLADLTVDSDTLCLIIDGHNTSISEETIRQNAESLARSIQIRDHRRHKLEADLEELECTAADFTYSVLNQSGSIPSWLTGTHYFRTVEPISKYENYESLYVIALYLYQPVTKNPDQRSLRLYRFAKCNEDDKGIPKAVTDMICRRFLRAADDYDIVVPFPSHDGGYSKPIELTGAVIEKSTPLSYRRLLTREENITQQKELESKPARWTNASDSISVNIDINNASIILLDDICTSGASLTTAAHELRQAGAEEVVGMVYGLNTGWGDITEIKGPGATITHIKQLDQDKLR